MSEKNSGLKVIIVGGSVAGLTLAHSLSYTKIDYVVLEAYKEVAPQVGASIGILPNGARVLDQLGCFDDISSLCYPMETLEIATEKGEFISKSDASQLTHARFNYPISFIDRQMVLQVLYDHLKDKSKVLTNKRVRSINETAKGVVVTCEDGTQYEGDIVAGADGVHSTVRSEMWRHADTCGEQALFEKDKHALSSEYRCLFGISNPVPGFKAGTSYRAYNEGWSFLIINGKDDRCFWFAYEKLPERVYGRDIPRYSKADELEFVKKFLPRYVNRTTTFEKLWERKIVSTLISLDEASHEHWTYGRIACLGDSIHKMTPNLGQGGNCAIESAAALTNHLFQLDAKLHGAKASPDQIRQTLKDYEQERQYRQNHICNTANNFTRTEAFATPKAKFLVKYIAPKMGDYHANLTADSIIGATKLDILPVPKRSLEGNLPFDPNGGIGHKESLKLRALYALPLLGLAGCATYYMNTTRSLVFPQVFKAFAVGSMTGSGQTVALWKPPFFRIGWLDNRVMYLLACFTPSVANLDPVGRDQMIAFLFDIAPVSTIWMIEKWRRGNSFTLATLSTFFELAYQNKGIGWVSPIYYFIQYVQSPQERYAAADNRLVPVPYAKTIIPTIALGYVLPTLGMFLLPFSVQTRQNICAYWQLFPIWNAVIHRVLAKTQTDTTPTDRLKRPEADMPYLRNAYIFGGAVSGLAYLYLWTRSPFSMKDILFSGISNPHAAVPSAVQGMARFLKYDHLFAMGSGLVWQLMHFRDLKKKGKTEASWGKILGLMAGTTLVLGPGAAMAFGWAWREEVMAKRKRVAA